MRIYMLEDDKRNGRVIRRTLDSFGVRLVPFILDNEPIVVASMAEEAIRANPPQLVVTDGLEGEAHRVISAARSHGVPVIVYTGAPRAFEGARVTVIPKPGLVDLKAAVRAVVDAHTGNG